MARRLPDAAGDGSPRSCRNAGRFFGTACPPTTGVPDLEEQALDAEEQGIGFSVLELT